MKGMTTIEVMVGIFTIILIISFLFSFSFLMRSCKEMGGQLKKDGFKNTVNQIWEGDSTDKIK